MCQFPAKLPESARTGFVEDVAFTKLLNAVEEPGLLGHILCSYRPGFWKVELKNLLQMQVADEWISLFAGATKNSGARKVAMPADVRTAEKACCMG
jgi:hypothetical protein